MKCRTCDIGMKNIESTLSNNWQNTDIELSPTKWSEILKPLQPEIIHVMGTEPLMYHDINNLLYELNKISKTLRITTNGWYIEKYFDSLVKYCDRIGVSIDGIEQTHDKIRGVSGGFERAFNGLIKLNENGKETRVSYTITPDNMDDMFPLYRKLSGRGILLVFNHYNFYPGKNTTAFNPQSINIKKLSELVRAFKNKKHVTFEPMLNNDKELREYYQKTPDKNIKQGTGCRTLERFLKGQSASIRADGRFIVPARCWIGIEFGYAENGLTTLTNNKQLQEAVKKFRKNGIPPRCQRLCCAGKCV